MPVTVTPSTDERFVLVRHRGQLREDAASVERALSGQPCGHIGAVLLDFSEADCAALELITVDSIAASVRRLSPQVERVAIVPPANNAVTLFQHAVNLLLLQEIDARLVTELEQAVAWLQADA